MRILSFFLFFIFEITYMYAQTESHAKKVISTIVLPDTINKKLECIYEREYGLTEMGGGFLTYNILNQSDSTFGNGIYSYKLLGPHFAPRIFIFNNEKTYIFNNEGAFAPIGVLEEYLECIKALKLSDKQVVAYLKAITHYLEAEQGQTYGREIKQNR